MVKRLSHWIANIQVMSNSKIKKDLFKIQYYKENNKKGRAKKLLNIKYEDPLEKLVCTKILTMMMMKSVRY